MKKIAAVFFVLILAMSNDAFAVIWAPTITAIKVLEVSTSTATNGTNTYMTFTTNPGSKPTCGTAAESVLFGSTDNIKAMTDIGTAAMLAGKQVAVCWSGTCTGTYAQVVGLRLY